MIRRLAATQPMLDKIVGHQRHIAQAYGISMEHARWLLTTVAFHCLALTSSPTFALCVSGGGFPLLGDSCSRSTWFLLHRAA